MKQSKLITVPIKAQSSKKHPVVHLAYITDKEQDLLIKKDLYGSLKGKPNRGPGGLPSLEGDFGPGGKGDYEPAGPDVSSHTATGEGGQTYAPTPTTSSHHPGDGDKKVSSSYITKKNTSSVRKNSNLLSAAASYIGKKLFSPKPKKPIEERARIPDMMDMRKRRTVDIYHDPGGTKHGPEVAGPTTTTLVTAPTADKSFGHQWDFKAYDNQQATTTPNVYDYSKAPYAKKGKMIYKYATGQEVKKRSLPPSKGPDSKGLPAILENSDYFTKLIGG